MIIINTIEDLLQRISSDTLDSEPIAYQTEAQIIPLAIIDLIKQLNFSHDVNKSLRIPKKFSLRQRQCLDLLFSGMSNKEIARELNLSVRTVEKYLANLKNRMNVRTRLELVLSFMRFVD